MSKRDLSRKTVSSAASGASRNQWGSTQTYVTVGVVAAAVSASVAYLVWSRYHARQQESVQGLLDDAHSKVRSIEKRLGDLRASSVAVPVPSARYAANADMGA